MCASRDDPFTPYRQAGQNPSTLGELAVTQQTRRTGQAVSAGTPGLCDGSFWGWCGDPLSDTGLPSTVERCGPAIARRFGRDG
ncbi:hypothetical protein GCM10022223_12050 [Kineosporia mesophila]|uniref:Uncharacterized protein n=1 Tax=Kineosporia mesophila TaxID=566012 RepID=A0ABP6Z7X0_9ACTN